MSDTPRPPARLLWPWWVGLLVLVLFTAVLYGRVLGFGFLDSDDPYYVTDRPEIRALAVGEAEAWGALLSPERALAGEYWEYYPVRDLTYGVEAALGGISPGVFHGTQLALHLLFVVLVFLLGWRLGLHPGAALGGAALAALHPLAVEPVCWVSSRKDVLMSVLVLGSLVAFTGVLDSRGRRRAGLWVLVIVLTLLAFGSKGPGVVAVLLAGWIVAWRRPRSGLRRILAGLGVLALAAVAWFLLVRHIGQANEIFWPHPDGPGRWFRALGVPVRVVGWILAPVGLCPYYGPWMSHWLEDPFPWVGVLAVAVAVMSLRRRSWRISPGVFLLGAFVLAVLPASGVVAVAHLRADRFYYLALAFGGLGAGQLAVTAWTRLGGLATPALRGGGRAVVGLLCVGLLAAWTTTTHRLIPTWRNQDAMWARVMEIQPEKHFVLAVRAERRLAEGDPEGARRLLHRALEVADRSPQKKGRFYRSGGVRDVLWSAHIWLLLSESWARTGEATPGPAGVEARHRAVVSLQQSIAQDPEYAPTWTFEHARRAAYSGDARGALRWSARLLAIPGIRASEGDRLAEALILDGHADLAAAVRAQWQALHPAAGGGLSPERTGP